MSAMDDLQIGAGTPDFDKNFFHFQDLPDDLAESVMAATDEVVTTFVEEMAEAPEQPIRLTKGVFLQALQKVVREQLKVHGPKPNVAAEDGIETSIRRERAVAAAVDAACDVLKDLSDGSWQEYEHLVAEVAHKFLLKVTCNTRSHMLKMDIDKRVAKNIPPIEVSHRCEECGSVVPPYSHNSDCSHAPKNA